MMTTIQPEDKSITDATSLETPKTTATLADGNSRPGSAKHDYVLTIDDDPGMHTLLRFVLRPLQLEVKHASHGYEALDMLTLDRPRLVILDLQMPGLDGFGVLERLGEERETADIPVVILSAHASSASANGYKWPSQVVAVLDKTVPPSELRELVRTQLHG
jgi:CheY-like chemotaxis protein